MIGFARLGLEEARLYLRHMIGNDKWDTSGGLFNFMDLIGQGVAFMASDDGGPLAVIVVEQVQHAYGGELVVRVAWQLDGCGDITERVLPAIEKQFGQGMKYATIYTKRAGLVKKLESAGYTEAAKIMRKKLCAH